MTFDTYTPEGLAEYRTKEAMREAEQARLGRVAQRSPQARQRRWRTVLALRKLRALVVDRSLDNYVAGLNDSAPRRREATGAASVVESPPQPDDSASPRSLVQVPAGETIRPPGRSVAGALSLPAIGEAGPIYLET